jgi:hypothetical protein
LTLGHTMARKKPPTPEPPQPPDSGGSGGIRERGRVEEIRLYKLALSQAWDVPIAAREKVVARLIEVVNDKASTPRELTSASKALMSATSTTLSAISVALAARAQEDLADDIAELRATVTELKEGHQP